MIFKRRRVVYAVLAATVVFLLWNLPVTRWTAPGPARHKEGKSRAPVTADNQAPVHKKPGQAALPVSAPTVAQLHPAPSLHSLPPAPKTKLPKIQFGFPPESKSDAEIRIARQKAVKEAFVHSWKGYRNHAWLKDELGPVNGGYRSTFGGWAATLVDSLDTLWIMDLKDEFEEALAAVANIDFDRPDKLPINVFETTIRYLGGFLGAYDVSEARYPVLLKKAVEVGEMLYVAFDTPNRMPVTRWSKIGVEVAAGDAWIAELGSLSLEFTRLSQLTGEMKFFDAIQRITDCIDSQQMQTKVPGMLPHSVNARECDFSQDVTFSIGGYADSAYEYLPKTHQLLQGATAQYETMYGRAIEPIKQFVLFKPLTPSNADILFPGTLKAFRANQVDLIPQMQHLSCFAGGMFALGSKLFSQPSDLEVARKLVDGCVWAYNATASGIMPELFHVVPCPDAECKWDESLWSTAMRRLNTNDERASDASLTEPARTRLKASRLRLPPGIAAIADRSYALRPEAIESIFVLYRITGDTSLLDAGWAMFEAVVAATRTDIAFAGLDDVTATTASSSSVAALSDSAKAGGGERRWIDRMQSFWTAETLKYFYLLFSEPSYISLDDFVLSTEAHPFRIAEHDI